MKQFMCGIELVNRVICNDWVVRKLLNCIGGYVGSLLVVIVLVIIKEVVIM